MTLQGAQVVVIGGSSGIGLATAAIANQQGAHVTIAGRSPERFYTLMAPAVLSHKGSSQKERYA